MLLAATASRYTPPVMPGREPEAYSTVGDTATTRDSDNVMSVTGKAAHVRPPSVVWATRPALATAQPSPLASMSTSFQFVPAVGPLVRVHVAPASVVRQIELPEPTATTVDPLTWSMPTRDGVPAQVCMVHVAPESVV
ncbi:MAG: hypothetical protein JWL76_1232 [Thermoleophilia bacterium]|nr:hypothetical protein [Thermoleophilia bacterium]